MRECTLICFIHNNAIDKQNQTNPRTQFYYTNTQTKTHHLFFPHKCNQFNMVREQQNIGNLSSL